MNVFVTLMQLEDSNDAMDQRIKLMIAGEVLTRLNEAPESIECLCLNSDLKRNKTIVLAAATLGSFRCGYRL